MDISGLRSTIGGGDTLDPTAENFEKATAPKRQLIKKKLSDRKEINHLEAF